MAAAPGLSSVQITDLTLDENNEIHVEVKVMGTAKSLLVWWDNIQCKENNNETINIVGSDNIIVGAYRYFHTGCYYSEDVSQTVHSVQAQAINAMSPWNTISTSKTFTLP